MLPPPTVPKKWKIQHPAIPYYLQDGQLFCSRPAVSVACRPLESAVVSLFRVGNWEIGVECADGSRWVIGNNEATYPSPRLI